MEFQRRGCATKKATPSSCIGLPSQNQPLKFMRTPLGLQINETSVEVFVRRLKHMASEIVKHFLAGLYFSFNSCQQFCTVLGSFSTAYTV